nr:hypothetical protein [Bacillus velezensis]
MKKIFGCLFFILLLARCGVNNEKSQGEDAGEKLVTKEGTYVGLADTHTIEVTVDHEPVSFDITEESADDVKNLDNGDKVTVKYQKNSKGQLMLKDIEPAN